MLIFLSAFIGVFIIAAIFLTLAVLEGNAHYISFTWEDALTIFVVSLLIAAVIALVVSGVYSVLSPLFGG